MTRKNILLSCFIRKYCRRLTAEARSTIIDWASYKDQYYNITIWDKLWRKLKQYHFFKDAFQRMSFEKILLNKVILQILVELLIPYRRGELILVIRRDFQASLCFFANCGKWVDSIGPAFNMNSINKYWKENLTLILHYFPLSE